MGGCAHLGLSKTAGWAPVYVEDQPQRVERVESLLSPARNSVEYKTSVVQSIDQSRDVSD